MSQIAASSRLLPQAGIALILMPCLIVQKAFWAFVVDTRADKHRGTDRERYERGRGNEAYSCNAHHGIYSTMIVSTMRG